MPVAPPSYRPQAREFTVTTVPLLVREAGIHVAVEGDTIRFRCMNPEDDEHCVFLHDGTDTTATRGHPCFTSYARAKKQIGFSAGGGQ